MKNWLKRNIGVICTTMLGLNFVYHIHTYSTVMFGEPEFPTAE